MLYLVIASRFKGLSSFFDLLIIPQKDESSNMNDCGIRFLKWLDWFGFFV
jgi:hypothetical protein